MAKNERSSSKLSLSRVNFGRYAIDSAIRYLPNVYSVQHISRRLAITSRDVVRRTTQFMQSMIDCESPYAMVLSHKYYNSFGVLGAVAIVNEILCIR